MSYLAAKRLSFCLILLFLLFPSSLRAEDSYAPETLGFLYEDCKKSIEVKTLDDFSKTYCGAFMDGLTAGFLRANWILLASPESGDKCENTLTKEHKNIDGRFCRGAFNKFDKNKTLMLPFSLQYILGWGDYASSRADKEIFFSQKVSDFFINPELCTNLDTITNDSFSKYKDLKLIKNTTKEEFKERLLGQKILLIDSYKQCKKDLSDSNNDVTTFNKTLCGAQISGYLAGNLSTYSFINDQLNLLQAQKNPDSCNKVAEDLYKAIDVTKEECISTTTTSLQVANKFIAVMENQMQTPRSRQEEKAFSERAGTIGYFVIYYHHMCRHWYGEDTTQ